MAKKKQFAVLGLGQFGNGIAKTLIEKGQDVLCCDKDEDAVAAIAQYGASHTFIADLTDPATYQNFGLNNFDVVIIAMGSDFQASIMATLEAKEHGAKYIISKAKTDVQKTILEKVGADKVVLPEHEMGVKLATSFITTNVFDYINLSDKFSIAEVSPKAAWVGKTLAKSNIRAKYGLNIVAIKRGNGLIVSPRADEEILEHDILVSIGETEKIQSI
ncbi:MAG: TrkA family potassium uptake protein [Firmicutes bacterium]|nr:TrkA family potassium uptake protein [Bacillota bacterium]